jgi:hypothetical protein
MIIIKRNNQIYDNFEKLQTAIDLADGLMELYRSKVDTIFTVEKDDVVLASFTNRRIVGTILRNHLGQKGNEGNGDFIDHFDATNYILSQEIAQVIDLLDHSLAANNIGYVLTDCSGQFEVEITQSMCDFFGVSSLADLTPSNFSFVKSKYAKVEPVAQSLTISVQLNIHAMPSSDIGAFIRNLDIKCISKDVGIMINSTKIVDFGHAIPVHQEQT